MKKIEHWIGTTTIDVAESAGGVLATLDPLANLVRAGVPFWPAPELIQKLYASGRWRGKTEEDDREVRRCLGHYCDLQSLNSEDAITWISLARWFTDRQSSRTNSLDVCSTRSANRADPTWNWFEPDLAVYTLIAKWVVLSLIAASHRDRWPSIRQS